MAWAARCTRNAKGGESAVSSTTPEKSRTSPAMWLRSRVATLAIARGGWISVRSSAAARSTARRSFQSARGSRTRETPLPPKPMASVPRLVRTFVYKLTGGECSSGEAEIVGERDVVDPDAERGVDRDLEGDTVEARRIEGDPSIPPSVLGQQVPRDGVLLPVRGQVDVQAVVAVSYT